MSGALVSGQSAVPGLTYTATGFVQPAESAILAGLQSDINAAFGGNVAFNVETWAEGDIRCFVIGDANRTALHELSELVRNAAR